MNWYGLRVYGLQLDLPAPRRSTFLGHHLRGLLGRALFETVCLYAGQKDDRACAQCPLQARCAYPLVFKPVEPDRLAPYWLHYWQLRGPYVRCTWHVLEQAHTHLEAWLFGLQRHWPHLRQEPLTILDVATGAPVLSDGVIRLDALHALAPPEMSSQSYRLQTLTPLVSKHRGDPLYGALRTRLQRLIQHYGDGARLIIEEQPWKCEMESELAVDVVLDRRALQGHLYRMNLRGISEPARELLQWGRCLHAGGHTSVGCGAYTLETIS
ncbi:MAG: hypothetical protein PHE55_20015 [Methylococcaceae bacterium]|nr:hypothetical protein [Methylococcaceae bacterium]